eukprot:13891745-Alexandrium_andersonii.AAC.1
MQEQAQRMRPLGPHQRRRWPSGTRRAVHPDARADRKGHGDKGRAPAAGSSEETPATPRARGTRGQWRVAPSRFSARQAQRRRTQRGAGPRHGWG